MVPCQPPVVELRMHLMQCVLTAQQEKQEGARAWKDCLGTQGSSSEARAPEAWCGARSSRQRGVGPWAGRGPPHSPGPVPSPPSLLLGPGVLYGDSNYFILLFLYL